MSIRHRERIRRRARRRLSARSSWLRVAATCMTLGMALPLMAAQSLEVGLASDGTVIEALLVEGPSGSEPTVLIIGGLARKDASVARVQREVREQEARKPQQRKIRLIAIPLANPAGARLEFEPQGTAFRDHPESHALWRWMGLQAPDLVFIAGDDPSGLGAALSRERVAGVGSIPARALPANGLRDLNATQIERSPAAFEIERRLSRSPRELALELARHYGHEFDTPLYIQALALIGRLRLGELDDVRRLAEPWVDGSRDSLARPNSLVLAGHLVFTELARRTRDERYTRLVKRVGDLGFDAQGNMLEAMPYHGEYSDAIFMGTVIAAQAGSLTGERKYYDFAARHLAFMRRLVQRPDGLYRHIPAVDAAWGRGNAFAALGLTLTLDELPMDHPERESILAAYRDLMAKLLPYQMPEGTWRNVIDYPGAYAEYSATAMFGFAMLRGVRRGWLPAEPYRNAIERAWQAVLVRTGPEGQLVNVCESTPRMPSLEAYVQRAAVFGTDPRGGAMALLFATEMAGLE